MPEVTRFSCGIERSLNPADIPLPELIVNIDEFL
jgi:hypothetical protein